MASYRELLTQVKAEIDEIGAADARERAGSSEPPFFLDVREREEWEEGFIPGALHIPRGSLESRIEGLLPDRSREIVVYCAVGARSAFAAKSLTELGYEHVSSLTGGFTDWKRNGFDVETPLTLSPPQRARYSRHLLIPEVGEAGQQRLLASRVLLIGAGGLGSPAALYLAAAGVGTIGIVDFDVVDLSNLQRQIIHTNDRIGERKVESARKSIEALNPDVKFVAHEEMLLADNVERIINGYDVIVDGTDTFETRYLLNDAAVAKNIPVIHASVFRFEGQLTTFVPYDGPCYRCLYPTPPPPELAPGCSVAGVLGVVPGIMGMLQANEALKVLLGLGDTLSGRLLLFDALDSTFTELKLRRDPACPVCSTEAVAARAEGRPLPIPSFSAAGASTGGDTFVLGGGA
jgi:sulfur-carrier protein adenylyltransferase/sulfurtransferase